MMILPLSEIPRDERHLLFCSRLTPRQRSRSGKVASTSQLAAINRSLAALDDSVACTWPVRAPSSLPV